MTMYLYLSHGPINFFEFESLERYLLSHIEMQRLLLVDEIHLA